MRVVLLAPGKPKPKQVATAVDAYMTRLDQFGNIERLEIRDEKIDRRPPETIRDLEGERLLAATRSDDWVAVCDERGRPVTTTQLTELLGAAFAGMPPFTGRQRCVIVIGGALGVSDQLRRRADAVWSLSALTMAGSIARLVLAEAIYRACCCLHGHPYHNA